jgi:glutathione S-transferase
MLQLYFWPMACSLASRIALLEAGLEARYRPVDIFKKSLLEDGGDFRAVSAKGAVPVLVLEDGQMLTENAAVLQYIADLRPESGLAPPPGQLDRYRLQEWLSFVGSEIHKGFLFPIFWYRDDGAKACAQARIGPALTVAAHHLEGRPFLVGDRFTIADAYLAWSLLLLRYGDVDVGRWPALAAYLERIRQRPAVAQAIDLEQRLRQDIARS